jgi:hypothetical protein
MSIDELRGHGRSSEPAATHVKHADRLTLTIFEPSAEVIRKGKAAKPTEFGKLQARAIKAMVP